MPLLALGFLLISSVAHASWQVTCACEWNPWTRMSYLTCNELKPDGRALPTVSQQPFNQDDECRAEATRVQAKHPGPGRGVANRETPEEVSCDCDWNPWRGNFLLSCTAWYGDEPSVRILDRMPFGGPKGRRGEAEKSCFAAKTTIEAFGREIR